MSGNHPGLSNNFSRSGEKFSWSKDNLRSIKNMQYLKSIDIRFILYLVDCEIIRSSYAEVKKIFMENVI